MIWTIKLFVFYAVKPKKTHNDKSIIKYEEGFDMDVDPDVG